MNPLLEKQLKRITAAVDDLTEFLERQDQERQRLQAEREKSYQRVWQREREAAVMRQAAQDYDKLLAENERLRTATSTLRQRLEHVLARTKALSRALRT